MLRLDEPGTISSDSSKELEKRTLRSNAFPGKGARVSIDTVKFEKPHENHRKLH